MYAYSVVVPILYRECVCGDRREEGDAHLPEVCADLSPWVVLVGCLCVSTGGKPLPVRQTPTVHTYGVPDYI